ncbi:MAG: hypothetical protein KF682_02855 [Nitrospira sp.]|nr:hypothetical protein [Nitrospira sp.]
MRLLDSQPLIKLQHEFRLSMRRLYADLCRELHVDYVDLSRELKLPTGFFDHLQSAFPLESYSTWKVVGWIETLNDLVYLLDVYRQLKIEQDRTEFAAQFFDECREKFFEHGYFDDIFPSGRPHVRGLEKRLWALCRRLAGELTQEALWFDPGLSVTWLRRQKLGRWDVPGNLKEHFERAELPGAISTGIAGAWCEAPDDMRKVLSHSSGAVVFRVESGRIKVRVGRTVSSVWSGQGKVRQWHWAYRSSMVAAKGKPDPVTVGPTLVYGKDRQPKTVKPTDPRQVDRITRAWETIRLAWTEGHDLLTLLTDRIIPLQAKGVVSFSYRHRPGLSFINCFDRGNLDLIDDLIHENSHHHLNLLLRKQVMYRGDRNQQIFYSPWRRSLRPLRGILHATFTFTMGALLFEQLSSWGIGRHGASEWKRAGLTMRDLQRARFRCLEELASVRYSLQDLHYADHHLGWLTGSGRRLVGQLTDLIDRVERNSKRMARDIDRSPFAPALRKHLKELQAARHTYGPMRITLVTS